MRAEVREVLLRVRIIAARGTDNRSKKVWRIAVRSRLGKGRLIRLGVVGIGHVDVPAAPNSTAHRWARLTAEPLVQRRHGQVRWLAALACECDKGDASAAYVTFATTLV